MNNEEKQPFLYTFCLIWRFWYLRFEIYEDEQKQSISLHFKMHPIIKQRWITANNKSSHFVNVRPFQAFSNTAGFSKIDLTSTQTYCCSTFECLLEKERAKNEQKKAFHSSILKLILKFEFFELRRSIDLLTCILNARTKYVNNITMLSRV